MDLFEAIRLRHSYRGAFNNEPIPHANLKQIVQAGLDAPTACNAQSPTIVVATDAGVRSKIVSLFNDMPMISTAQAFIVLIANEAPVYRNTSFWREDCAAAAAYMLLSITSFGYASVWLDGVLRVGDVAKNIGKILNVPADRHPQILLPVGVPATAVTSPEKKPFSERAWFNRYGAND